MNEYEIMAECAAVVALIPHGSRPEVAVVINDSRFNIGVYPDGLCNYSKHFSGETLADAFTAVREWCADYPDQRRAEAEKRLREAQAEVDALGGAATASLPVEVHHGVGPAQ